MKKLIVLFAFIVLFQQVNAQQSFDKGSLVTTINYGIDIYSVLQTTTLYNVPNSKQTKTDTAGSKNFNFELEYGLFKWLGLGIHLKFDNYYTSKQSNGYTPTAYGFEGGVLINIHVLRARHFDLLVGGNIGYSSLVYTFDNLNDQLYGSGTWTDLHISPRLYFGRFGINMNFYHPIVNYPNLTTNNSNIGLGETVLASWLGTGNGITIGLQYRILN